MTVVITRVCLQRILMKPIRSKAYVKPNAFGIWTAGQSTWLDVTNLLVENERTKQLTDQRHILHHHHPVKSRLHSRNTFVSTSQPLLCKPAEARIAKWQEQWEQTDSNPKMYNIDPKRTTPERSHAAGACMADIQPSALWTGCHPGSETSVGLPGQQQLYVRRSHMRPEPHHDELHTFRRETDPIRHCRNEGWIRAVAESHCRHDMMTSGEESLYERRTIPVPASQTERNQPYFENN